VKDETIRGQNAKSTVMTKLEYDQGYSERLKERQKENETLHKGVLEYRTEMHEKQRIFEAQQKENALKRNPFNAKMTKWSMENATKKQTK